MLAHVHRSDPNSPMYAPASATGVLLCHGCRDLNRCRMGLQRETLRSDGVVVSELMCPPDSEGGPNVAHGGWTAGMLDELVGHTMMLRGEFAVTGTLEVVFHKPMPIELPLIATAQIERREGRKAFVSARIELASSRALLASAKAIMVLRPANHFERHEQWLQTQVNHEPQ
ncbi:aromatic compound degradation protein PaaI (plasmid) [Mycobacterium branderi]|nr:aromatic compound degradation protein PaaI [Mycobacterium branderi]